MLQARRASVDANEGTKILFFHQPYHKRRKAVFVPFSENQNSLLNRHKATAVSCRPEVCVNWACNSSFPLSALLFAFLSPLLMFFFSLLRAVWTLRVYESLLCLEHCHVAFPVSRHRA